MSTSFSTQSLAAMIAALGFITTTAGGEEPPAKTSPATSRPNVLLIVSDDQGYMDAGFQGGKDIPTPSLDRLARSGVRCTSGYVTHPFCSPTRAALMTGRYQQRFGHEYNPSFDPADVRQGLPLTETLLPEPLARAGYVTGWIGKWHLGHSPAHSPLRRGFTEGFGFLGAGHHFQDWKPGPGIWDGEFNIPLQRNGRDVEVEENLTPAFGKEAAAFVTRHAEKPWFLYLAFNAPHSPHEPTAEARQRFAHSPGARGAYCAQVSLMDDAIGAVLESLDRTGQYEHTLVFFFSDNGGEFIYALLARYFKDQGITFTRSRPLEKNESSTWRRRTIPWSGKLQATGGTTPRRS